MLHLYIMKKIVMVLQLSMTLWTNGMSLPSQGKNLDSTSGRVTNTNTLVLM